MDNIVVFFDFLKKLYKSRYMVRMLAVRELKTAYIGSAFGFTWAILNPLVQVLVYGVVFGVFFKSTPDPIYKTDSFLLFLLCGIVPWQFFSQSLTASTGVILANRNLIKKAAGFPSEILPVTSVISNIISHLIGLALLIAVVVIYTGTLSASAPLIFVYMLFAALFAIGIGWVLSSVNVFLRDIQQVLSLAVMVWVFLTPVFYPASIIPAWLQPVMKLNPLYHVVEGYRLALLAGAPLPLSSFAYLGVSSFVMFGIGGMFFRKLKPWFGEVL